MGFVRLTIVVWAAMLASHVTAQPVARPGTQGTADAVDRLEPAPQAGAGASATNDADTELAHDTVRIALDKANNRLVEGRYEDAIVMAWAGMRSLQQLPRSAGKASMTERLLQLIVNARIAQRGGREANDQGAARLSAQVVADAATAGPNPAAAATTAADAHKRRPSSHVPANRHGHAKPHSEADLYRAYKSREAGPIARQGVDPRISHKVLVYPDDWVEQSRRRRRHHDGVLHKGEAVRGKDGKVRQTVIYDIRSLVFPSLKFNRIPWSDLHTVTRNEADREALRRGSEIFNGYPRDLAAGIPLLDHFGGTGDWPADIGDGQEELTELMRLIDTVIDEP